MFSGNVRVDIAQVIEDFAMQLGAGSHLVVVGSQHELLIVYDAPEWHEAWARAAVDGQLFVNQLELLPDNPSLLKQLPI